MGVSHRPGFGLLGSVPRSLSTQPPFATQALIYYFASFCSVSMHVFPVLLFFCTFSFFFLVFLCLILLVFLSFSMFVLGFLQYMSIFLCFS